jgi:hypothetical protein
MAYWPHQLHEFGFMTDPRPLPAKPVGLHSACLSHNILNAMADPVQSTIIKHNLIWNCVDAFLCAFTLPCERRSVSCGPNALGKLRRQGNPV